MEKYVEVVVAYFKELCRYSPFRAEEVRKKKNSRGNQPLDLKPGPFWIRSMTTDHSTAFGRIK